MLFKSALLITSTLATLSAATPLSARADDYDHCITVTKGTVQCCQSFGVASSLSGNVLWGLINILGIDLTATIGLQCNPVYNGGSCNAEPVCCTGDNDLGGLIIVDCSRIAL